MDLNHLSIIRWLIRPSEQLAEVGDRRNAQLLSGLLITVMVLGLLSGIVQLIFVPNFIITFIIVLASVAMLGIAYGLSRTRHYKLGALFASFIPSFGAYINFVQHPDDVIAVGFMLVGVLMASMLLSSRTTMILALLNVMAIIASPLFAQDPIMMNNLIAPFIFVIMLSSLILLAKYHRDGIEQERQKVLLQAQNIHLRLTLEQEKGQILRQFISNLSHDLKTPLSVIKLNLSLLQRITNPQKQEELIETINLQTQRLEKLIQDILTVSRLDQVPEFEFEPIDLNVLVRNIEEQLSPLARQKNLAITSDLMPDLELLLADKDELARALVNLIENAITYTTNGTIAIRTHLDIDGVIFEVSDTGIGISPLQLLHIFERFYRADEARSNHTGGTGLGLAIVKRIIDMHGGIIEVESVLGVGSTFRIKLPFIAKAEHKLV